jgi:hypothetical protein
MGCYYTKYRIASKKESLNLEDLRGEINKDEEATNSAMKESLVYTDSNYTDTSKKKLKSASSDNFPRDLNEQVQAEEIINVSYNMIEV